VDVSAFFDYPDAGLGESAGELVFLRDRSEADWEKVLAHTDARRLRAGEEVIRAGDSDCALYLVTEGALDVFLPRRSGGSRQFKSIEAPSVIGEVSFVDGGPRSTTLRAATDGELRRLSRESFEVLAAREPELARAVLFDVARILSRRLRTTTSFIADWVT
jgi:CRP/FNR family transcriptional regulator, cyclic AMP receptor protein